MELFQITIHTKMIPMDIDDDTANAAAAAAATAAATAATPMQCIPDIHMFLHTQAQPLPTTQSTQFQPDSYLGRSFLFSFCISLSINSHLTDTLLHYLWTSTYQTTYPSYEQFTELAIQTDRTPNKKLNHIHILRTLT